MWALHFIDFSKLEFICKIICRRNFILMPHDLYTSVISTSVHKMALFNYFKEAPNTLPNPNSPFLDHMPSEIFLQLIAKCQSWFTKTPDRTLKGHKYNSRSIRYSISTNVSITSSTTTESLLCYGEVHTLNYGGMTAMLPHLTPTVFVKLVIMKLNFSIELRNV